MSGSVSTPPWWPRSRSGRPSSGTSVRPSSPTPASTPGLRHYDRRHPHFSVELHQRDGTTISVEDGYFAICLNTDPYTFLGERPFNVAPGTGLDTPLSVVVFRSLSAANLLGPMALALRAGEGFARRRKITVGTDVVRAVITPYAPVPYQVDGDYLGDIDHLEFRWEPAHLLLIVPRP